MKSIVESKVAIVNTANVEKQTHLGDQVHATVRSVFVPYYCKSLPQGKTYIISHFHVFPNKGTYSTTDHLYRVYFKYTTFITACEDNGHIHPYGFQFKRFKKITNAQFDSRYLVGLAGSMNLKLMDANTAEMESLNCTLSGAFADEIVDFLSYATTRLKAVGIDVEQAPARTADQFIAQIKDEFLTIQDQRNMSKLQEDLLYVYPVGAVVIVLATIVDIQVGQQWCYYCCKDCDTEALMDGDEFFCPNCYEIAMASDPKYMLHCIAQDAYGTCGFIIPECGLSGMLGDATADLGHHYIQQQKTTEDKNLIKAYMDNFNDEVKLSSEFEDELFADECSKMSVVDSDDGGSSPVLCDTKTTSHVSRGKYKINTDSRVPRTALKKLDF
ncbi:uncharacterized protein LOC114754397 [Neltuma alba]|uniref:uncharacterized protein LOC114754397 n=1 Tax=Neltuma alba TaxID=207710 RepID=UPI0010A58CC6|nr:uncharacterized protein LOC114754397 [Prosopis alba]